MRRAFVLSLTTADGSYVEQRRINGLPIRLGRNQLNDIPLNLNFVSDFHAQLLDLGGRLAIRDMNSKNGVFVRPSEGASPMRINPQGPPIEIERHGNEFFIGPLLRVQVSTIDIDDTFDRPPASRGSVLGNKQMLMEGLSANVAQPPMPLRSAQSLPQDYGLPRLPQTGPQAVGPHGGPSLAPLPDLPPLGPGGPPGPMGAVNSGQFGYSKPPTGPNPYAMAPPNVPPQYDARPSPANYGEDMKRTGHFAIGTENLAFQGLKELAASLVPGVPLETTGDVARLITKLHDTVEVFCRCFIPLRQGHAQFISSMDLQRAAMQRSMHRSQAYMAVEMANNAAAVAHALLDWRDQSLDAPKAVEGIFADLMLHQVALLDGVMRGVRALLDDLSPEAIEKTLDSHEGGLLGAFGGRRHKALWEAFCERYEQLSEEKQAFSHIFGPEFTEAYREYRKRRTG